MDMDDEEEESSFLPLSQDTTSTIRLLYCSAEAIGQDVLAQPTEEESKVEDCSREVLEVTQQQAKLVQESRKVCNFNSGLFLVKISISICQGRPELPLL